MNYKDVVQAKNDGEVFLCKLKDGKVLKMQVHDTCESPTQGDFVLYNYDDPDDLKGYLEGDVEEILELVKFEGDSDRGGGWDTPDFTPIKKYQIDGDVFQYKTKDELKEVLEGLNCPVVSGAAWDDGGRFIEALPNEYGIVFYWSEYDDFSCYGDGFTHHVKVIDGVQKV